MFIERITERESRLKTIIDSLKLNDLPLVLYGGGCVAQSLYRILERNGIDVDYVAVDRDYYQSGKEFMGISIRVFQEIITDEKRVNVLLAHDKEDAVAFRQQLLANDKINEIYIVDYEVGGTLSTIRPFEYEEIFENRDDLEWLYQVFEDKYSRNVLCAYIQQRISGDFNYLRNLIISPAYFHDFIGPIDGGYIDCGAFNGDTVKEFDDFFASKGENYDWIIAFEPDKGCYESMIKRLQNLHNFHPVNKGIWSSDTTLKFSSQNTMSSALSPEGDVEVEVIAIDNHYIGKVGFIKMDVEGSELEALKGAEQTIRNDKPILAVCVYHKFEDLLNIPRFIKKIKPDYKLYLRAHLYRSLDIVLYAIP